MRFSVIMPVRDASAYIEQALASIAAQTHTPAEILIIDDGSSDDSMDKVVTSGLPARIFRIAACNAATARNVGIAEATGEWLAFLDADDVWFPQHLARAASLLERSDAVALLANHVWRRAGVDEALPQSQRCCLQHADAALPASRFPQVLAAGFHFGHSTEVLSRERTHAVNGFDETQHRRHDLDLWLRAIHGHQWAWDTQLHAAYRIDNPNSLSTAAIECELAHLQVLLRHEGAYPGLAMRALIATSARRAMGLAFVDGTDAQWRAVRTLAWAHLTPRLRAGYNAFALAPPLARYLLRQKRKWLNNA